MTWQQIKDSLRAQLWMLLKGRKYSQQYRATADRRHALRVHDSWETLDEILRTGASVSRFGDGELQIMQRYLDELERPSSAEEVDTFQHYDASLGKRLYEVWQVPSSERHLNCVPYAFKDSSPHRGYNRIFFEREALMRLPALEKLAREHKPKMIIAGASAYARTIDFERIGAIAKSVGAYFMVDMAHIAGLVAAGQHPSPIPHADVVTSTTHKTLRGPRGGIILGRDEEIGKKINKAVFPGIQGGPLMHVIAAKAVALGEALAPSFKEYGAQVVKTAAALADELMKLGYRIVSGGTDTHVMLVDLTNKEITGKDAQNLLDEVNITANRNTIPFEPRSPFVTSGLRLGSPALTTRGFKEEDMREVARIIAHVLDTPTDEARRTEARSRVAALCAKYPLYE
mgnify:CR=1 FL=1